MLTSLPQDARFFGSRAAARAAKKQNEKVVRLGGVWGAGSFGIYPKLKNNGQYIGGPNALVSVWMTTKKGK